MNYLEWNNAIGKWYFNEEKAEQEVYLFISKHDLVQIGKNNGIQGNEEDIFLDYVEAIRKGIPGKSPKGNIISHALYAYRIWRKNPLKVDGVYIEYPLYLAYLTLFVLPLTESLHLNLRANTYYRPVRSFLKKYDLPSLPNQNDTFNWNPLWLDLEEWSIIKRNTEVGYFELHPFSNQNWVYVGKPLSQTIFPIHSIKRLPQFFESSGLVPGEETSEDLFRKLLLAYGEKNLGLPSKVLNAIRDPENELGSSLIGIVSRNYRNWTGNTDFYDLDTETTKKGYTIAQLRLCVEGNPIRGYRTYYRLYSKLDLPEDLTFAHNGKEFKCQQFGQGWSKHLLIPYSEGVELQDNLNKWKAKFPKKDVRLLTEGKNFHLSGWVEVPYMITSKMLLLVKEGLSPSIEEWGECFPRGDFKRIPKSGLPEGLVLYEISNPPIGHPDVSQLQFKPDKRILLTGGLKTNVRTWLNTLLPEVELENGRGTENVYLTYEDINEKIPLKRKAIDQPVWVLPSDIRNNIGFFLKDEHDEARGGQLKNIIVNSKGKADKLKEETLPARDRFGLIVTKEDNPAFVIGSKLLVLNERKYWLRQSHYKSEFRPQVTTGENPTSPSIELENYDDLLVNFLTVKGESTAKEYFEAFESVYQISFSPDEIESHTLELSKLKRWSLNYLDYMGILDYEYSNKKIVVNPPQFILIPTGNGRKVLLIGGRTKELLQRIQKGTHDLGLFLNLEPQHPTLSPFLLPPAVTVVGFHEDSGDEIENKLKNLAESCSIIFNPDKLPQFRLIEFSGNIREYTDGLTPDEGFDDSGWPARVFDPLKLRFIPMESDNIDKTYSLVEYRLTEYSFKHRLWKDGKPYHINKNWGRYMILENHRKNVIFNDRKKNIVAIPATLPLPRLISEAMTLFSGKAPRRKALEIEGNKTWYIIYNNLPHVLAYNTFLKVGQKMAETQIEL